MKTERLISLDALRGFTIVFMVIVNSPGSWSHLYAPLHHASWHGITPTDFVFPFFLFIVGVSITLAYSKQLTGHVSKTKLYSKILIRAAKIFLLGMFLNFWQDFDLDRIRVAGVLQRIAIVYAVCSILFINMRWKRQLWVGVGLLVGYWALLSFVPVPMDEVAQRALEEGVVERSGGELVAVSVHATDSGKIAANYEPGTNLAAWIDRQVLPGRFWENSWDPEGLTSTLPSIVTGIFGMLIGSLVLSVGDPYRRVSWIFLIGFTALLLGEIWSWGFPLNKNLWSSSFVLWAGGLASMFFASCILIVDILGYKRWTKLGLVYGANAIVSYALSGMLVMVFYDSVFGLPSLSGVFMDALTGFGVEAKLASLLYAILYMLVVFLPAFFLYRKRIFIRL